MRLIDSTLLRTYGFNFLFTLWHQDIAIVESVTYSMSFTKPSKHLFVIKATSVISNIAISSFLGIVADISFDLAVNS